MAAKKPLVLTSGQIEQLQTGDTLDAVVSGKDVVSSTNDNASPITICQAVYQKTIAGHCDLARANAAGTARVLGLVADASISASASGNIQSNGVFTATTTQWDAVTGASGGLTAGSIYYLSGATAGNLTSTAPTSGYVTQVGQALSTTELLVEQENPIKL